MRGFHPQLAARQPEGRVAARTHALALLNARERRWLADWNRTSSPYPLGETVPGLFESQVRRTPGRVALVSGSRTLIYAELNRRANRLANELREHGVGPDVVVGLCAERSVAEVDAP